MAQAKARASCGGLWLMSRGGLCFETRLPRAGGPPLELRPQQKEAGRLDVSPSCHVASLNLTFLHCKMGKKTPKVVGLCDFSGLTWEPDRGHSKSCSEDRGSGMCWGGADRAVSPWSHLQLLGPQPCGLTSFPQPSIPNSVLDSAPISERIRKGSHITPALSLA